MKEGKDLHPGILGINMRTGNPFADAAVIAAVRANSPAYKAGFKQGDTIVQIDGREIIRQMQVQEALGPHYAGDKIKVVVTRGKERIERELELIDKLEAYSRPFLGILPQRLPKNPAKKEKEKPTPGVVVRMVYPNSPADKAGIDDGDRILAVNGKEVADRDALREAISNLQAGAKAVIDLERGGEKKQVAAALASPPEAIPAKLPPAMPGRKPYLGAQPPVGKQPLKLAEFKNECFLYVPVNYDPAVPHGVVVWFHEAGALKEPKQVDELIDRWKALCDANDLILVVPKAEDPLQWNPGKEVPFIAQAVEKVRGTYTIDDARIVAHGYQAGGSMASALAFQKRELVRGVAIVDALLAGRAPETEPIYPLAFYMTQSQAGRVKAPQVAELVKQLRAMKYPVTVKDLGKESRNLNADELAELMRWIDTLDRI
jgi:serine protease Do